MGRPKRGEDDGRERLLAAAVTLLDTTAESTLHLDVVAALAGATVPLISHHFGSREQLITEAQEVRFAKSMRRQCDRIRSTFAHVDTTQVFCGALDNLIDATLRDIHTTQRRYGVSLIALFGAAHGRDTLADSMRASFAAVVNTWLDVLGTAQVRGIVAKDVDVRVAATVVTTMLYGTAVSVFTADLLDLDRLKESLAASFCATLKLAMPIPSMRPVAF
jgi:AcrR family transcriptional regulator